jgi:putative membrane protein
LKKNFSENELEQIKNSVSEAEKTTSAEIVPVFYTSCSDYWESYCLSGMILSLIGSAGFVLYNFVYQPWLPSIDIFFLSQLFLTLFGALLAYFFPSWRRLFLNRSEVRSRIQDKAYRVFLEEGISSTKDKTGILLFMSFFEQEAVLITDEGIRKIIPIDIWDGVLLQLMTGMKTKNKTEAIIDAIDSMGSLLKQIPKLAGDKNELRDDLRMGGQQ